MRTFPSFDNAFPEPKWGAVSNRACLYKCAVCRAVSLSTLEPMKAPEGLSQIQESAEAQQRGGVRALSLFTRVPMGVPVDLA